MNYIVFDLEWNQSPRGKRGEIENFPFEIIEIGAVKLNEKREKLDSFRALIRPAYYTRLHFGTSAVIGLTNEDLRRGVSFREAVKSFLEWCGEDFRFCTWGVADVKELQRNLRFYGMLDLLPGPVLYDDVQKLFALAFETKKERRALRYAVEYLNLPEEAEFHFAKEDAVYTAQVFQRIPEKYLSFFSVDSYQNPLTRDEELLFRFDRYEKFISREFDSREQLLGSRDICSIYCFECGKPVRRSVQWFTDSGGHHIAVGHCPEHGFVKSKIRVNETEDGGFYAVRTTKMISEETAAAIRNKKQILKLKRQNKRKK